MIGPLRNRTLAIAAVAALQLLALTAFVWEREAKVRNGSEVVLEVVPVDPRSLFQGDYVILGYPISTIKAHYGAEPTVGQDVYVAVMPQGDGNWGFAQVSYSPDYAQVPGGVVLKGRIDRILRAAATDGSDQGEFRVVYGLERFFVPEGKGLNLEELVRTKKLSAIVSVWRDGSSTLKGLKSDGKVLYETGVAAKRPEEVPPLTGSVGAVVEEAPVTAAPAVEEPPVEVAPPVEAPVTPAAPTPPDSVQPTP